MTETPLDVLHDHYKDSFSHIREREKQRDRLFLVLIGLFALLSLQVLYPADFGGALGPLKVSGAEVDLGALPLPALLSASWVFTFAIALRYCQVSINVERQYPYLHALEEKISEAIGDRDLYRREGRAYLQNYPLFSDWAWFCYVFLFPAIVALATLALSIGEWAMLPHHWIYKLLDSVVAAAILISFLLYRILPLFNGRKEGTAGNADSEHER